jgi:transglutaminase-like putative cysteine protease
MRFEVRHVTTYRYDKPVALGRHLFRMQPRPDGFLVPASFSVTVYPPPLGLAPLLDLEGNLAHAAWFEGMTQELRITVRSAGETRARTPLLADFDTLSLPLDYGAERVKLFPYLWAEGIDPAVGEFSRGLAREAGRRTFTFLDTLNARLRETVRDVPRMSGHPYPPERTLAERQGSCRDFAVLFIACCRVQGIAARFVSGYLPAGPGERQHMHAWAEAYLPGMGWQAYDPTREGGVGERHIAVAAAAEASDAGPVVGHYSGLAESEMTVDLVVRVGDRI